jgi:lipopolysaccharide/colanic/teichoic acid biosynthesis glycosyltransferase
MLFDIITSFLGIAILSPFLLVIAVLIMVDSEGPIIFRQIRVGKAGKEFRIFKFRTMVQDAEKAGLQITVGKDKRITRIGIILRKYKLDEFPQLINVLIGEMSLVGPRPEVPKYVAFYTENQRNILKVQPGITDYASIKYKDECDVLVLNIDPEDNYINEIMPQKIEMNFMYIKAVSLVNDLKLIFGTIFAIMPKRKSAKSDSLAV